MLLSPRRVTRPGASRALNPPDQFEISEPETAKSGSGTFPAKSGLRICATNKSRANSYAAPSSTLSLFELLLWFMYTESVKIGDYKLSVRVTVTMVALSPTSNQLCQKLGQTLF